MLIYGLIFVSLLTCRLQAAELDSLFDSPTILLEATVNHVDDVAEIDRLQAEGANELPDLRLSATAFQSPQLTVQQLKNIFQLPSILNCDRWQKVPYNAATHESNKTLVVDIFCRSAVTRGYTAEIRRSSKSITTIFSSSTGISRWSVNRSRPYDRVFL